MKNKKIKIAICGTPNAAWQREPTLSECKIASLHLYAYQVWRVLLARTGSFINLLLLVLFLFSAGCRSRVSLMAGEQDSVSRRVAGSAGSLGLVAGIPVAVLAAPITYPMGSFLKNDTSGYGPLMFVLAPAAISGFVASELAGRPIWVMEKTAEGVKYICVTPYGFINGGLKDQKEPESVSPLISNEIPEKPDSMSSPLINRPEY